ncbi:GAF domain-containing protein [Viridibacterium curvum]|uniref:GAF domain-containing protein n=1 Tax=Viridibacterium curvum TaxID=1101404 RepID=A0ABP9Q7V4_9RHOO
MKLDLDTLRQCMEGSIPPILATCAPDGTPNISYVSQMEYVDAEHVALSFQFFNKTRANILAHPFATAYVTNADTGASYRLSLQFTETRTSGKLFERMKARLAGIASQTGMQGIFHLQGADVYRVLAVETVDCDSLPPMPPRGNLLSPLRVASDQLASCRDLDELFDTTLRVLAEQLDMPHSMLLLFDPARNVLATVASRGYDATGIGSEVALGIGVIGVAAAEREPIRIGFMTSEYRYTRAIHESAADTAHHPPAEVPFPGLAEPHSQVAVPVLCGTQLLGVLYADSLADMRFNHLDEDALVVLSHQLGALLQGMQTCDEDSSDALDAASPAPTTRPPAEAGALRLRYYPDGDCVFANDDYLIKGVAGAVLWKLLGEYTRSGRADFTNRELRLDPALRLPDIDDNLEARLVLLARRLRERCPDIAIEKTGRGRFRLNVQRPLDLAAEA